MLDLAKHLVHAAGFPFHYDTLYCHKSTCNKCESLEGCRRVSILCTLFLMSGYADAIFSDDKEKILQISEAIVPVISKILER